MEPEIPDPPAGAAAAGSALTGKAVLVTGAARRVGASIARALHAAGADVLLHYRSSADDAAALAAELNGVRPRSAALAECDLLETARLPGLVAAATRAFGGLDILVNNASTFYPTPVGDIAEMHWDDLVGTNLKAPLFLAQAAAASSSMWRTSMDCGPCAAIRCTASPRPGSSCSPGPWRASSGRTCA